MNSSFEELDYRPTALGALSLRRRHEPKLGIDALEIKLGDEFLMTSLFTASELALARLGVSATNGHGLDVVVGGLGLGYTARAVLEHDRVRALLVIEYLEPVIEWHRERVLPLGSELWGDDRCRLVHGDFFAMAEGDEGFDCESPGRRFDAVLVDIDHSPEALLDDRSQSFYRLQGLRAVGRHLKPGGVFGLWSNDTPDPSFLDRLGTAFPEAWAEPITFHNPLQDRPFTQTVYLARTGGSE